MLKPRLQWLAGTVLAPLCAALFLVVPTGYSQLSSGSILGTVADTSGAVIPGAQVKITNTGTGAVRELVTNESGSYRADLLPPGEYQVEAELPGFRKEIRKGITLSIDQRARIDFSMVVGEVAQVVNVEGQAPIVQTDDSNVGQVVDERKIVALPLNGREFSQLAYIVPGAFAPRPNSNLGYRGGFSIAGELEANNQYLLDGVNNNANGTNEIAARVNIDAVGEFKVQTANYSAQYGRYAGGQVDAVTKSGTNELHGSAFYFHRNSALDARNFFDPYPLDKLPEFRRHQYGAALGGPIVKNKLFFFMGYQGQRQFKLRTFAPTVPLPEFFTGNLSKISTAIKDPSTGLSFPGNIIPRERLSPIALGFQQFWPSPNRTGLVQNANSYLSDPDNYNQTNSKIDYQISSKQKLSGSYTYYNESLLEWLSNPQIAGFQTQSTVVSWNLSLSHVYTISPTLINEARAGISKLNRGRFTEDADRRENWNAILGIPGTMAETEPIVWGVPLVSISGYAGVGNPYPVPQPRGEANYNFLDNVSLQHGSHALKFGVDFLRMQLNENWMQNARGSFSFTGARTGNAMADFLLGLPAVTQRSLNLGPLKENPRRSSLDLFAQDDWKVFSKLTLNIGLRWEGNFRMEDRYGRISSFDASLGNGQGGLRVVPNHQRYQAAIDKFHQLYPNVVMVDGELMDNALNNFAPRFGFAYSPFGGTSTVVRGGYGVFYQVQNLCYCNHSNNPPFVLAQRFTTSDSLTLANPWSGTGSALSPAAVDVHEKTPYYQNWNLGIQRQLPGNFVLDVAYQGKKGTRLIRNRDINQPLDRTSGIRPYPLFGQINYEESAGSSIYHALHLRSERRAAHGLSFILSYMWGKLIDDLNSSPQDSYNLRAERGLGQDDVRHRFTFSPVYQLPFGHGRQFLSSAPLPLEAVLGGWEISGVTRANSGYPFTASISTDNSGTGNLRDRPNQVNNANLSNPTPGAFWNRNAFTMPAKYQFGNAGRNTLTGPGSFTQDVAMMKVFAPAENQQIQLRFEMFNAFNHANFDDPSTTWNSTSFGSVRGAFDSRQIQVGMKWIF